MKYILFDDVARPQLLPFTHTRPVADIRCGILTMRERWELLLGSSTGTLTEAYLQIVYPQNAGEENVYVNGAVFATAAMKAAIAQLKPGQSLTKSNIVIAACFKGDCPSIAEFHSSVAAFSSVKYDGVVDALQHVWDIFSMNDQALREDHALLTNGRKSAPIPEGVTVTGKENLFIEEGANVYAGCIINADTGPIYIGKHTEILEGTLMRGPIAIGEHAVVKMGAKLYGGTTIGPGCKVGGEINNVVFFANSNKAHDGYLGNAVIGEWCNLGADTNCSNLKNNYAAIKIWDEATNKSVQTGLTFCGLMMGDHSKCAINTMFNTGTVVGVSCNIFGGGFPEKFVRSFTWGGVETTSAYDFNRAMETAARMMARRGQPLTTAQTDIYKYILDNSK
jgi:UDP-N-acetylglucosamine diphosphorylase/glucosamine-1-phosphate N-acetyltransferase